MCLEHDFGHFNFLKLQDVFWDLDPTPYSSTNPDKSWKNKGLLYIWQILENIKGFLYHMEEK